MSLQDNPTTSEGPDWRGNVDREIEQRYKNCPKYFLENTADGKAAFALLKENVGAPTFWHYLRGKIRVIYRKPLKEEVIEALSLIVSQ